MPPETRPLIEFIDAVKGQGASDEFIVALLKQNGWSEKRIYQAFGAWYETRTGRAVPNSGGRIEVARDAFFYLLSFITLGIWTIQLGALLFAAIDQTFPNPALDYRNSEWQIRGMTNQLAGIIIAFPLFLFVNRIILKSIQQQQERLESSVRKWLTYIALVITASTVIGDVVTFLAYLLRGDLNTRFVLKVLTLLLIAGGVFAYYLDSLNRDRLSSIRNRSFNIAALAAVAFGVIVGFAQIGSPSLQRARSEDNRRLYDLSLLAEGIHIAYTRFHIDQFVLPDTLQDVLRTTPVPDVNTVDPVSGRPYEYHRLGGTDYQLCATFSRAQQTDVPGQWHHPAGRACFLLNARNSVQLVPRPW